MNCEHLNFEQFPPQRLPSYFDFDDFRDFDSGDSANFVDSDNFGDSGNFCDSGDSSSYFDFVDLVDSGGWGNGVTAFTEETPQQMPKQHSNHQEKLSQDTHLYSNYNNSLTLNPNNYHIQN